MCRSIKVLRQPEQRASEEEVRAAALQFVRKISGYRTPSNLNRDAFDAAVEEITQASSTLLASLSSRGRMPVRSESPARQDTSYGPIARSRRG